MYHNPDFVVFALTFSPYLAISVILIVAFIATLISTLKIDDQSLTFSLMNGFTLGILITFFACTAFFILLSYVPLEQVRAFLPIFGEPFFTFYAATIAASFLASTTISLINIDNTNSVSDVSVFNLFAGMIVYPMLFAIMVYIRLYIV